jgi:hypothetical protein
MLDTTASVRPGPARIGRVCERCGGAFLTPHADVLLCRRCRDVADCAAPAPDFAPLTASDLEVLARSALGPRSGGR